MKKTDVFLCETVIQYVYQGPPKPFHVRSHLKPIGTGRARLIQSHSSARFFFEFSGSSNYNMKLLLYHLMFDQVITGPEEKLRLKCELRISRVQIKQVRPA